MSENTPSAEKPPKEVLDVKVRKEVSFPVEANQQFEAIIAALANSEAKCLTMLCLSENPISAYDLHNQFQSHCKNVWKSNRTTQAYYCQRTLAPIGMVAELDTLWRGYSDYVLSFRASKAGVKYGKPIAAYLLRESLGLENTLSEIFASTHSPGETRAAVNRAKIILELGKSDNFQRTVDLARKLNINQNVVGSQLKNMSNLGLVEYESISPEKSGSVVYKYIDHRGNEVKAYGRYTRITFKIIEILRDKKAVNNMDIVEELSKVYPKSSINSLKQLVTGVLSDLALQGVCEKQNLSSETRSKASLTTKGKKVYGILLNVYDAIIADNDKLREWSRINWQNYTPSAIENFKRLSKHINVRDSEENEGVAYQIIKDNPGIRTRDIETEAGKKLTPNLRSLITKRMIKKEKVGREARYYATDL